VTEITRTPQTATASTVPEPIGNPAGQGLWKHKGLQLPPYIQHVATDLIHSGHPESQAIGMAVGIVRNWAEGHDGKGHPVHPDVQAAAAKNIAQWDAMKARTNHGAKRSTVMTDQQYDADGLDGSWDSADDLPDMAGLDVADFDAAAAGDPDHAGWAGAGDVTRAAKLGSGARFAALKAKLAAKGVNNPGALAAHIGRAKYGKGKFVALAAKARKGSKPAAAAASRSVRAGEIFRFFPLEECRIMRGSEGREYAGGRVVEAYAAVFDQDAEISDHEGHYVENIDPTAFDQVLRSIHPDRNRGFWNATCLYNHGMTIHGTPAERFSLPAGLPKHIASEGQGLLTRTEYAPTPLGDELLSLVEMGALRTQSFTGAIMRSTPALRGPGDRYRARGGVLERVKRLMLGLREYGLTPFAAYSGAEVLGVRMQLPGSFLEVDDLLDDPDSAEYTEIPDGPYDEAGADHGSPPEDGAVARSTGNRLYQLRTAELLDAAGIKLAD
jgi:phage head maturation protease